MNPYLEEIVENSLKQIDEVVQADAEHVSVHMFNILYAVRKVYNNSNNYRVALEKLYEKDPYVNKAVHGIATIILMMCGILPQLQESFKEEATNMEFEDYSLKIEEDIIDRIIGRYPDFITFEEGYGLILTGESKESAIISHE